MGNNFNISEWRRQQLQKEIIKEDITRVLENEREDDLTKYRREVIQQLLSWYKKQDDPDQKMIEKLENEIKSSLKENISLSKAQKYPKDVIMNFDFVRLPKRGTGPGSGVDVFSKEEYSQIFDLIPDMIMYTVESYSVAAQQAIPTFLFPKGEGYSDEKQSFTGSSYDYIDQEIAKDIAKGRTPRLD